MSFLNKTGLSYLWTKIKNYLTGAHVSTSAINGATTVDGALTKLQTKTGTATLTTTAKNLSGAVNELDSGLDAQSQKIDSLNGDLAIVANGNTHAAIKQDQFVYIKNHSTLAEGLYRATAAIPANDTLSTSNLIVVESGGLNALNSNINDLIKLQLHTFTNAPISNGLAPIGLRYNRVIAIVIDGYVTQAYQATNNYWYAAPIDPGTWTRPTSGTVSGVAIYV